MRLRSAGNQEPGGNADRQRAYSHSYQCAAPSILADSAMFQPFHTVGNFRCYFDELYNTLHNETDITSVTGPLSSWMPNLLLATEGRKISKHGNSGNQNRCRTITIYNMGWGVVSAAFLERPFPSHLGSSRARVSSSLLCPGGAGCSATFLSGRPVFIPQLAITPTTTKDLVLTPAVRNGAHLLIAFIRFHRAPNLQL